MPRWTTESDDAAVLARAILAGTVTDDHQSFKDFFGPESSGPGAEIGQRYGYGTKKGQRNLKLNVKNLVRKINCWKQNKKDPETGKPVRFSDAFLKKAGFPDKPEILSDVPQENRTPDFVPGRDQLYEDLVEEEREQEEATEDNDNDSLSICGAGHENPIEEEFEEEEEEPEPIMPAKKKFPALSTPFKAPGQCDVSWEILDPVFSYVDVEDPDNFRRKTNVSRKGIVLRVDIPAGVAPLSFVPDISHDGRTIVFDCYLERSRYVPRYTLDRDLQKDRAVAVGVQKALQDVWTHITRKQTDAGEIRHHKRYSILLPEPVEREFRDPYNGWIVNEVGKKGMVYEVAKIRSMFYFSFLFTVASKDVTPATAAVNSLLRMGRSNEDNDMNAQNMALSNYLVHGQSKSHRRSSHRQPKSPDDISDAFDNMSLCSEVQPSRKSTRRKPSKYSETESQKRDRVKAKQRKKTPRKKSPKKTPRKGVGEMTAEELEQLTNELTREKSRRQSSNELVNHNQLADSNQLADPNARFVIPSLPSSESDDSDFILPLELPEDNESDDDNLSYSTPEEYSKGSRSGRSTPSNSDEEEDDEPPGLVLRKSTRTSLNGEMF